MLTVPVCFASLTHGFLSHDSEPVPRLCTPFLPNYRLFLWVPLTSSTCCGILAWWSSWAHQSHAHLPRCGSSSSMPCYLLRILSKQKTTRGTYNLQIAKSKKQKILNIHQCFNFYWSQSTQKTPYEWFCSVPSICPPFRSDRVLPGMWPLKRKATLPSLPCVATWLWVK